MSTSQFDPFRDLLHLQERMNRLFQESLSRTRGEDEALASGRGAYRPSISTRVRTRWSCARTFPECPTTISGEPSIENGERAKGDAQAPRGDEPRGVPQNRASIRQLRSCLCASEHRRCEQGEGRVQERGPGGHASEAAGTSGSLGPDRGRGLSPVLHRSGSATFGFEHHFGARSCRFRSPIRVAFGRPLIEVVRPERHLSS